MSLQMSPLECLTKCIPTLKIYGHHLTRVLLLWKSAGSMILVQKQALNVIGNQS